VAGAEEAGVEMMGKCNG